jgi:hypothetical protein
LDLPADERTGNAAHPPDAKDQADLGILRAHLFGQHDEDQSRR